MRGISIGFGIGIKYQNALHKSGGGVVPPAPEQPDLLLWDNGTEVLWDNEKPVELFKIPDAIRKSMVVWYDVAKQGATNESMQANPVLKDFSGNGHDATCYNFAWSKNSVIKESNTKLRLTTTELIADNAFYNLISFYRFNNNTYTTEWRIKVAGLKENQGIRLFIHNNIGVPAYVLDNDGSVNEQGIILSDGTYLIKPALNANTPDTATAEFYATSFPAYKTKSYDVTIELLPQYPNALVSDGVDDYCLVEGLPILTKEKGYTVIAKRKLFYKENTLQVLASTGAFILERQENTSLKNTYNFGSVNTVTYPEEITYQTSKSFNGTSLNVGDSAGTDSLKIFTHIDDYASIALYSLLLFNRDLTDEEIEWVKTNLIEQ